jgi:hypothetical protein
MFSGVRQFGITDMNVGGPWTSKLDARVRVQSKPGTLILRCVVSPLFNSRSYDEQNHYCSLLRGASFVSGVPRSPSR